MLKKRARIVRGTWIIALVACLLTLGAPLSAAQGPGLNALPLSDRARFGVCVTGDTSKTNFDELYLAWYLDWQVRVNPPRPGGIEFVQLVHVKEDLTTSYRNLITQAVDANPGSWWLVGNEPDHLGQDNCLAGEYAYRYRQVYNLIKGRDPTAKIAAGGLVQATPLRLHWLNDVLSEYQRLYGQALPADGWHIHEQILRETCASSNPQECWGALWPPGLVDYRNTEGVEFVTEDAVDVSIFQDHVRAMRTWMKNNGYRATDLIISEFGVLQPSGCGYLAGYDKAAADQMVHDYMIGTHQWLVSATDSQTGHPGDGNRLAQRWAWYSMDKRMSSDDNCKTYLDSANGSFYMWDDPTQLTPFGEHFRQYMIDTFATTINIPLTPEWNLISYNVDPVNGYTRLTAVRDVLGTINGKYTAVRGFVNGSSVSMYPDLADRFNTLKTMDYEHGYWIQVTQSCTLSLTGVPMFPDRWIPLRSGWNLVSYLPNASYNVRDALVSINGQYTAVRGFHDGGSVSMYPDLADRFNTLKCFRVNHGYWIEATGAGTLSYPTSGTCSY